MATPTLSARQEVSWWKKLAVASLFGRAGFAVALALAIGIFSWYESRPKPQKPWNIAAIVVKEPPGFSATADGKKLSFGYSAENATDIDYSIDSNTQIRVMGKGQDSFTSPLPNEVGSVRLPIFIPARQKGTIEFSLSLSGIPGPSGNGERLSRTVACLH
jgi:hypothetical protein